jgi:hypothetical protein
MRTTVTLDPDVHERLQRLARERGISFKDALNSTLRRGLQDGVPRPYRIKTYAMGARPGVNLDKALQLASELEDEEIIRKLELGK